MMVYRTVKKILLSLLFFSSIASAQVPDEVIFYYPKYWQTSMYYFPSFKVDNIANKDPNYPIIYPEKFTWSDINDKCRDHVINGYCELYLYEITIGGMDKKIGLYKINLTSGEILPFVDLGNSAGKNVYSKEFNYSDGQKKIKTISHLFYTFGNEFPLWLPYPTELPLETKNNTKISFSYTLSMNYSPYGNICVANANFDMNLSSYSYIKTLGPFSYVPAGFGLLGTNLLYNFKDTVDIYVTENNQCVGTSIGSIRSGITNSTYPPSAAGVGGYFSYSNTPGSGFLFSYNNRILEINYAPPALSVIPNQTITANKAYQLDMKPYLSKIVDGAPKVTMTLQPKAPAGLSFDAEAMVLKGRANATGSYRVTVNASSTLGTAAPMSFMLNIGINEDDKPEWKPVQTLPAATVDGQYDYDLNRLLAKAHGAVTISLAESFPQPEWVQVVNGHLTGTPTANDAGSEQQVTLFAESSTGGHTRPLTVSIPVAYDARLRPVMKSFEWTLPVGFPFNFDLRDHVVDPTNDANVEIVLDKVEPASDWLAMSRHNKRMLSGTTPENVPGQEFTLTMHAHNSQGGDSEKVTSKFKIRTSSDYKPRFNGANPILPFMIPGTPYFYDFTVNHDVFPEGIPFTMIFAEGYDHPSWLRLENNQLIADNVDKNLYDDIDFYVRIKNVPGGESEVIHLFCYVAN